MNRVCFALLCCGAGMAIGCQPDKDPAVSSGNFGRFEGEVVASWAADGRKMVLQNEFSYIDVDNRRWTAPAGSVIDGASIPVGFWTLIGGPFEGHYRYASVVHDVSCHEMTASWEDVHRMFYHACRCGGVDESTAKILYYAVYHFGPRWEPVTDIVVETHKNPEGQLVQERVSRKRMKRVDPAQPTIDEIEQVAEFIIDEDPNATVIEQTSREVLRRRPRRRRGSSRRVTNQIYAIRDQGPVESEPLGQQPTYQLPESNQQLSNSKTGSRRRDNRRDFNQQSNSRETQQISNQEKRWVAQQVSSYLIGESTLPLPAEYDVKRTQEGYRVAVRIFSRNRRGEATGYLDENFEAQLSSDGQVLQILR